MKTRKNINLADPALRNLLGWNAPVDASRSQNTTRSLREPLAAGRRAASAAAKRRHYGTLKLQLSEIRPRLLGRRAEFTFHECFQR